ncbi:MAG: Spy/CpxP family protein refolding chaperone [Pseudomonadota bacterium]
MKKSLIALATVATLTLATAVSAMPGFGPGRHGDGKGPDDTARVERMARMLDLDPAQQEKMKALFAQQAEQRTQMRDAMRTEMRALLTPEQSTKLDAMQKQRMARMEKRMAKRMDRDCDREGWRGGQ